MNAPRNKAPASNPKPKPAEVGSEPHLDKTSEALVKVRTSGNFNLMDPMTGIHFDANAKSVSTPLTPFVVQRLESGDLEEA